MCDISLVKGSEFERKVEKLAEARKLEGVWEKAHEKAVLACCTPAIN